MLSFLVHSRGAIEDKSHLQWSLYISYNKNTNIVVVGWYMFVYNVLNPVIPHGDAMKPCMCRHSLD